MVADPPDMATALEGVGERMTFRLSKVEGPECPGCGCCDSVVVERSTWFGKPQESRRCTNCGKKFNAPAPPVPNAPRAPEPSVNQGVVYHVIRCPQCKSRNTQVTSTPKAANAPQVRYHRCRECGHPFKSSETN